MADLRNARSNKLILLKPAAPPLQRRAAARDAKADVAAFDGAAMKMAADLFDRTRRVAPATPTRSLRVARARLPLAKQRMAANSRLPVRRRGLRAAPGIRAER